MVRLMLKTLKQSKNRTAKRHDITQGSLYSNIWHLAWPIVLSQVLFMIPDLYDGIWLGRLGSSAQAAAGLASSTRFTMISVLMALSGGSGAVVARYVGAKDQENANLAVLQSVLLMILSSGTLGVIGILSLSICETGSTVTPRKADCRLNGQPTWPGAENALFKNTGNIASRLGRVLPRDTQLVSLSRLAGCPCERQHGYLLAHMVLGVVSS